MHRDHRTRPKRAEILPTDVRTILKSRPAPRRLKDILKISMIHKICLSTYPSEIFSPTPKNPTLTALTSKTSSEQIKCIHQSILKNEVPHSTFFAFFGLLPSSLSFKRKIGTTKKNHEQKQRPWLVQWWAALLSFVKQRTSRSNILRFSSLAFGFPLCLLFFDSALYWI